MPWMNTNAIARLDMERDRLPARCPNARNQYADVDSAAPTTTESLVTESLNAKSTFVEGPRCLGGGFCSRRGNLHADRLPPKFTFCVALGASDSESCVRLHEFFGVGSIHFSPRRKPHFDNGVQFSVRAFPDLMNLIVPFMDEHLPPSYKRTQYLHWGKALLDYWEHRAKRPRPCTIPGCETTRRAHGFTASVENIYSKSCVTDFCRFEYPQLHDALT